MFEANYSRAVPTVRIHMYNAYFNHWNFIIHHNIRCIMMHLRVRVLSFNYNFIIKKFRLFAIKVY